MQLTTTRFKKVSTITAIVKSVVQILALLISLTAKKKPTPIEVEKSTFFVTG
jgi:hypothetical protein